MFKKYLSVVLAFVFMAVSSTLAYAIVDLTTVSRQYIGGYAILINNSFYSGTLAKTSTDVWCEVTDDNTETYYVDENTGYQYQGLHKVRVYNEAGTAYTTTKTVFFGSYATFSSANLSGVSSYDTIKLRIQKDPDETRKFQSKGSFIATYGPLR
ncbi:MAG: hypothetical protein IKQ36_06125 [Clostridia bacterium]|nr:hypothetical protein [Clostridia bacterium]